MPMSLRTAKEVFEAHLPAWIQNKQRIDKWERWYRGDHQKPSLPARSTTEYKELLKRSPTPWMGLVVTSVAQALFVEGLRSSVREDDESTSWKIWQANHLDGRQSALWRGALAHGLSYARVLPGDPLPVIRGVSARRMLAFYQDAAEDDWPMYAIEGQPTFQDRVWRFRLYDDEAIYTFDTVPREGERVTYITTDTHAIGVTPIVRVANQIDLDGRSVGEVEPFIPLISRIDQDTFDRLVVQRFQSWAVRWITGLVLPDQREEAQKEKLRLRAEDILIAPDPDTKIGSLPAGDLSGLIAARDADIKDLAAVSQTPPHYLLGQIINVSAEALAAAEAALNRKVEERKHIFGEAVEQALRLAAHLAGDSEEAEDVASEVRWRDMEARSLAQVADALGKMATMLGVPVEALWEKIPGTTLTEVNRWAELRRRDDVLGQMLAQIAPDAPAAAQ